MARLLIVQHAPTESVRRIADAVVAGANDDEIDGVEVVVREALEADADDVLAADGYVLGTPANFGYMSGALKHFFDSIFLQAGGALADDGGTGGGAGPRAADGTGGGASPAGSTPKPWGLWVHGRYDTTGAIRSVESIVQALPWRQATEVRSFMGDVTEAETDQAYELGATLAALLSQTR